jgi:hypothetical protein
MGLKSITKLIILFSIGILLASCDGKLKETPISQFEGIWDLQGRKMFNGV